MRMNISGNRVHDLMRKWIYDGEKEKDSAICELLENRPDHIRAMIKLHNAQTKINCAHAIQKQLKAHDEALKGGVKNERK